MYKEGLALNNLQALIGNKTHANNNELNNNSFPPLDMSDLFSSLIQIIVAAIYPIYLFHNYMKTTFKTLIP